MLNDARVLRELVLRLYDDSQKATIEYHATQKRLLELQSNYDRISEILNTRRGELRFEEVVESMGAESAFKAFEEEGEVLEREIMKRLAKVDSLTEKLNELTSKKRTNEILGRFRDYYASARRALNLLPQNLAHFRINSRPATSGSGGPRAILAYYAALWRICHDFHAPFSIPAIIDSPNQQSQDKVNLPKVLKFIAQELPDTMQLIVGLEMESDYEFDKVIPLEDPYNLLRESELTTVEQVLDPMLEAMFNALSEQEA